MKSQPIRNTVESI